MLRDMTAEGDARMRLIVNGILVFALATVLTLSGCETGGQTGALAGGGIGALAGQAIGGNTTSTLVGAAVGTGIGYMIGNEADKKEAREKSQASQAHGYTHNEVGPLGGTTWEVISISPPDAYPPAASRVISFHPHGRVTTTRTNKDGTVDIFDETYRVNGDMLIVNRPGYMINAQYSITGNQLLVNADKFRAVLQRR
jgi:hypothetical protein